MPTDHSRLNDLVSRLDDQDRNATLASIAEALVAVSLTAEDVAPYVRPNATAYHRARVVRRDGYELLVMTWLPGQESEPRDHTGSVCALQVIRGRATEHEYSSVGTTGSAVPDLFVVGRTRSWRREFQSAVNVPARWMAAK